MSMRVLFSAVLCLALAGSAAGQRRGGGFSGGGMRGGGMGGMRGGSMGGHGLNGGFNGGAFRGGIGGFGHGGFGGYGGSSGFRGYNAYRGFGGFGGYRNSYYGGWGSGLGLGWGYGGFGYGWGWPAYYGYPYYDGYYGGYYDGYYGGYGYAASPAVTVVYGGQQPTPPVYVAAAPTPAHPVTREYDQFGQEIRGGGSSTPARTSSPIYLLAFQDHVIRAANAYWVDGKTLHYVTLQHEERQTPIESLDRALTLQLNRERQVTITLP